MATQKRNRLPIWAALALLGVSACASTAHSGRDPASVLAPLPSERQLAWHDVEFYALVRFGIRTFNGLEAADGMESPKLFAPTELDCRQWARVAKEAGMKAIVLSAKDVDGFCLWPTATTSHSVASSGWQNGTGDVVLELADACRLYGLQLGVCLALEDRNCEFARNNKRYDEFYVRQQRELLTRYGDLFGFWIDAGHSRDSVAKSLRYDWPRYCRTVRELQPRAVIVSALGPDVRPAPDPDQSTMLSAWSPASLRGGPGAWAIEANGSKSEDSEYWLPLECRARLRREGAEHSSRDEKTRSLEELVTLWEGSIGNNAALLLELPVDRRGLVPDADAQRLRELAAAIDIVHGAPLATGSTTQATLELPLPNAPDVDRVVLGEPIEQGQRVRAFTIEARVEGHWQQVAQGTTIGRRRSVPFERTRCDAVRITIVAARAMPTAFTATLHARPRAWKALAELNAIAPR